MDAQLQPENQGIPVPTSHTSGERSVSAPLSYGISPATPPSGVNNRRGPPPSTAQRSISMTNGTHQNSPVMNETLSVIEEHITDMSTPRHSLLMPERRGLHDDDDDDEVGSGLVRRLSYINGHETDEEESGMLSEKEVRSWSPERVAEYLEDVGVESQQCEIFREQEISGDVLLGMDQGSLMLKEFELGSIGRRLALWQKIKAMQEEVRISSAVPRTNSMQSAAEGSIPDSIRNRSTSVGLPRIPSLMENSGSRTPSRQGIQRSPSHQQTRSESHPIPSASEHAHRPSAASVRSLNHDSHRRHSSIEYTSNSPRQSIVGLPGPPSPTKRRSHAKQGSFDNAWTMGSTTLSPTDATAPNTELAQTPTTIDPDFASFPHEVGLTIVSSIDLDRGYFSGNEADVRKRNTLKKKTGDSPKHHGRAPSDGYSSRRLSGLFRHSRAGSTESVHEAGKASHSLAANTYFGRSGSRATSGPQIGKSWTPTSPGSPIVTNLEYGTSSIDTVAASPRVPESETSSIDRPVLSPKAQKIAFPRSRATGLRAISDAITGNEKSLAFSPPLEHSPLRESPLQSPSTRTGSSTPSVNSKSIELDDSSLVKSIASSSGRQTPIVPRRKGKKSTSAYTRGLEQKSPKEQIIGCDYSGWMKKKSSNLMTTWKTRLFVLRGRRLSYYYSEDDTEEKGLIDISFHRVLPANNDRITGLHATVTGATASPISPQNAQIQTAASTDAQKAGEPLKGDASGMFIFKLVPPRPGLSKAVSFTKPMVHYFAVDNVQQGRLWMAALMKATIDRDDTNQVITTYKEKTISLAKARAMRQRPPALMGPDEVEKVAAEKEKNGESGLAISFTNGSATTNGDKEGSITTDAATLASTSTSTEKLEHGIPVAT
jgi:SAM domain (Sterile alpha motif)/PH domain